MFIDESGRGGRIALRFEAKDVSGTIALLQDKWKSFAPFQPFSYSFMDDRFYAVYDAEQRIGTIFGIFTGLASFIAEKRTKEIGIRKVLGASVPGVVRLLMREFVLAEGMILLIAMLTVTFQSVRAALSDPIRSLRYE